MGELHCALPSFHAQQGVLLESVPSADGYLFKQAGELAGEGREVIDFERVQLKGEVVHSYQLIYYALYMSTHQSHYAVILQ